MITLRQQTKLFLIAAIVALAGCAHNPLKTAETIEQKGDALYGTYVIAKEQGALILQDTTIPDASKRPLAEAMVASKEPADALQDSLIQFSQVKAQLAAGQTTDDQLLIASQNIDRWIVEARPLIDKLIKIVGGFFQ